MIATQDWIGAYLELCVIISHMITEIEHIDLDHDQLLFESKEYPFPESSLFIQFNTDNIQTIGLNVQDINAQIKFTYAFDTLSDTFNGSENQSTALAFGSVIRKLHALLQNLYGANFSSLDRISLRKESAPEGCIAYSQTYNCIIRDYSGMVETTTGDLQDANITLDLGKGAAPSLPDMNLFEVTM
jgi:hypothetical protein